MNLLEAINHIQDNTNFKNWFGKSVLHTNGKPHTFYHGTASDIHTFSHDFIGKGNDQFGAGFYFTNKPEVASDYTNSKPNPQAQNVIPVHLRVEKPIYTQDTKSFTPLQIQKLIVNAPNHKEALQNFGDADYEGYHKVLKRAVEGYSGIPKHQAIHSISNDFYRGNDSAFLTNLTKHTGHDAVIDNHPASDNHVVVNVFHPNQIKSAIGNSGDYSKKSNAINEGLNTSRTCLNTY